MKSTLCFIVLILMVQNAIAQRFNESIHFKNDSVIQGNIIEIVPNKQVTIVSGKQRFVVQMDDIEKITREPIHINNGLQKGFFGLTELGYGSSTTPNSANVIKINVIGGVRVNSNFSLGLGTGFRGFVGSGASGSIGGDSFLPFLGDFRFTVTDERLSPFFATTGGYVIQIGVNQGARGWVFYPAFGAIYRTSRRSAVNFSVGYDLAFLNRVGTYSYTGGSRNIRVDSQAITIQLGFIF